MKLPLFSRSRRDYVVLVYQAGIANVFHYNAHNTPTTKLVLQTDFKTAADYVRGVIDCGVPHVVAWCNIAGDIRGQKWNFRDFDKAPFCENFALDLIKTSATAKAGIK